jgi:hypothetical protein
VAQEIRWLSVAKGYWMSKVRLLVITSLAFATALALNEGLRRIEWTRPLTPAVVLSGGHVPPAERALRPNYPYSVIAGGAYSPAELRYSVAKETVVRDHYANFDLASARLVTLASDRFQYVSFRIKNGIYWTRRKIRIPKGEVLLTDGVHFARTRCGNRLCDTPQAATAATEPSLKALSLPPFSFELLAKNDVSLAAAPPLGELEQTDPDVQFDLPRLAPFVPPAAAMPGNTVENWLPLNAVAPPVPIAPGYSVPVSLAAPNIPTPLLTTNSPPPVITAEVPEPASIYLFLLTFAVSLWLITRWMRNNAALDGTSTEDEN